MKRREILKSAGCVLFLPSLESFGQNRSAPAEAEVKRLFCISMGYGFFTDVLPQTGGSDYTFSEHMEPLKKHRDHFTLYSKMKFAETMSTTTSALSETPQRTRIHWTKSLQITLGT